MNVLDRLPQLWGEPIEFREQQSALVELSDRVTALETIDFAGKKGSKVTQKKNCVKGSSCGFTCIRAGAVCRSEMKGKEKEFAGYLKKSAGTTKGKAKADPVEKPPIAPKKPKKDDIPDVQKETISAKVDSKPPKTQLRVDDIVQREKNNLERSQLVKSVGEELVAKAEKNLKKMINESDLFIQVDSSTLSKIIDSGRFKSSFETNNGRGERETYQKERSNIERRNFKGVDERGLEDRPIYGFVRGKKDPLGGGDNLSLYGDVSVRLHPRVKENSSLSLDDTFSGGVSSSMASPSAISMFPRYKFPRRPGDKIAAKKEVSGHLESIASSKTIGDLVGKSKVPYMEFQAHKQVKTSDISELIFKKTGSPPKPEILQWAKDNNVKITMI